MNQWYRKTAAKAGAVAAGVLGGAMLFTSVCMSYMLIGAFNPMGLIASANGSYEESEDFRQTVESYVTQVFEKIRLTGIFEMDGAYNPDKLIDILDYVNDGYTDGYNRSGVAYTLGELVDWGADFHSNPETSYDENNVIVCQKPEGSYYYYYLSDFMTLFDSGALKIEFDDSYQDQEGFLRQLQEGNLTTASVFGPMRIVDGSGQVLYKDCWNFGKSLHEKYAPDGAVDLLTLVNTSGQLNGKLSVIYNDLSIALDNINEGYSSYQGGWDYLAEGNTNFTYLYADRETKDIFTNGPEYRDFEHVEDYIEEMKSGSSVRYLIIYPKLKECTTNMNLSISEEWGTVRYYCQEHGEESVFAVAVDTSYPVQDAFYDGSVAYRENTPMFNCAAYFFFIGIILTFLAVIWITAVAGRRPGSGEVFLTSFDRWKTEIAAAAVIAVWIIGTWCFFLFGASGISYEMPYDSIADDIWYTAANAVAYFRNIYPGAAVSMINVADTILLFFYGGFSMLCFFAGYVSLIRRKKAKILWSGSFAKAVLRFAENVYNQRTAAVKGGLLFLLFIFSQWTAIFIRTVPAVLFALAADAAGMWFILSVGVAKGRIKKGIQEIASGNLEYRIGLKGLRGAEKDLAVMVNEIGSGLNRAVDEAMRNERLKTDLITNVSHDIKTPLTSIINYVDILKRSDITDEKILGYLDILEAKAQRLRVLTEDVVEASKVSSGNISLEYMDVDFRQLIRQTDGEMAEKFSARGLTVVTAIPEEPVIIRVDGRRMWRVLENIYNNAAKYAMPGTRVYADLSEADGKAVFTLKNVSEHQLNISADELTERFIRGDISRSTEGSGLGLSIAKSLTVMQGGSFELYLDGDLFRVNITFPLSTKEKVEEETEEKS